MWLALSIRQPWPWFILCGQDWAKDYENRDWPDRYARDQLQRCPVGSYFYIHASSGMTGREFDEACAFAAQAGATLFPRFDDLKRGGLVGHAKLEALVTGSKSKWFTGPKALKLAEVYPIPFMPCKGALGFFRPDL